jgi:hypothetical protein
MSGVLDGFTAEEQREYDQMQQDDAVAEEALGPVEPQAAPEPPEPSAEPSTERQSEPIERQGEARETEGPGDARALHEERNRRRELQQRNQELERKHAAEMARMDERLQMLSGAVQSHFQQQEAARRAPPAQDQPLPDFASDPAGHIQGNFNGLQQREVMANNDLQAWGQAQEAEFARGTPDYLQAATYLRDAREKQIRTIGINDPALIRQQMENDIRGLALLARQQGASFAERVYQLALDNGYQRQQPRQQGQAGVSRETSGTGADRSNGAGGNGAGANSATERLLRGQDMATTIGSTGGAARGEPAAQHLANLPEAEFAKLLEKTMKDGPTAMRNLFGS